MRVQVPLPESGTVSPTRQSSPVLSWRESQSSAECRNGRNEACTGQSVKSRSASNPQARNRRPPVLTSAIAVPPSSQVASGAGVDTGQRHAVVEIHIEQSHEIATGKPREQRMAEIPVAQVQRRVDGPGLALRAEILRLQPVDLRRVAIEKKKRRTAGLQERIEAGDRRLLERLAATHDDHPRRRPVGVGQILRRQRRIHHGLGRVDGVAHEIKIVSSPARGVR